MELQVNGWYIKLSSGIHMTRDIHDHTPVRMFFNNSRLVH